METPEPLFPISDELISCFSPRGPYYMIMDLLAQKFKVKELKLDKEQKKQIINNILNNNYPNYIYGSICKIKAFRNKLTHTFDDVTEDELKQLNSAVIILLKDQILSIGINKYLIQIHNAVHNMLQYIPIYLTNKKLEEENRKEKNISKPEESIVKDLRDNFKEELKGKDIEILTGKYAGVKGIFKGWDGTCFHFRRREDPNIDYKGSIKNTIRIQW